MPKQSYKEKYFREALTLRVFQDEMARIIEDMRTGKIKAPKVMGTYDPDANRIETFAYHVNLSRKLGITRNEKGQYVIGELSEKLREWVEGSVKLNMSKKKEEQP